MRTLTSHAAFNISNPNNCYALLLGFSHSPTHFHAADGSGYVFLADAVLRVDGINHQVRRGTGPSNIASARDRLFINCILFVAVKLRSWPPGPAVLPSETLKNRFL